MDGGAWWAAVHEVARSRTRLSDFTFTFHFHALEKEMVTHSSIFAWRIPGTGEPVGLPSLGSHRVGHDRRDLAAAAAIILNEGGSWVLLIPEGFANTHLQGAVGRCLSLPRGGCLLGSAHPCSKHGHLPARMGSHVLTARLCW